MDTELQEGPILQDRLPVLPWMEPRTARLPGTNLLDMDTWLDVDSAFAAQMALRDRLLASHGPRVHALLPEAQAAAGEVLDLVLGHLRRDPRYRLAPDHAIRPDGVRVPLDRGAPLHTAGRLVQADLCLMDKPAGWAEHRLAGAVLCFPAGWSLAQKLGMAMVRIHRPVPQFDESIAARVQRMFDNLRPDRPVWRANTILRNDWALFVPSTEDSAPRRKPDFARPLFLRSERQCLIRLPQSGGILFSIHTYVVAFEILDRAAQEALLAHIVAERRP